jgi:hypothetical protein
MLTCGLTGTKGQYVVTTTDTNTIYPATSQPQRRRRIFAHHGAPIRAPRC